MIDWLHLRISHYTYGARKTMNSGPRISVLMPSYNHARFVEKTIESVLAQQDVNFELIIEDDGSSDGSSDIIQNIKDNRIRYFPKAKNEGVCATVNSLIKKAQGEFIAFINSDDIWIGHDKLRYQQDILEKNSNMGACFGRAQYIDTQGSLVEKSKVLYGSIFDESNRSRGLWLRRFFLGGNCLCSPTAMVRKSCFEHVGLYDGRLRQLPDFQLWIQLIKHYDIFISDRALVNFRIIPGENMSASTNSNSNRLLNEHFLIAEEFFNGVNNQLMNEGFPDILSYPDLPTQEHLDIEKVLLFLQPGLSLENIYKMVGLKGLYNLLESPTHRSILFNDYSIDEKWLHNMMGQFSPFATQTSPTPTQSHATPLTTPPPQKKKRSLPFFRYLDFFR